MSEAAMPAIDVQGVTKVYPSTAALKGLSLKVMPGQVLGLLGPNGAGKSTLIKSLMGLVIPDAGEVRVLDAVVSRDPLWVKQHVGYVPEQHFMYGFMRVHEILSFAQPFYEKWNESRCSELVRQFGLDLSKRVKELSKGMLTKLSLVLALAHEPELLILDEPMAGLDALVREELVEGVLRDLSEGARTMLLSSHTFADVHRLADVIAIINDGQLLVHKPTAQLVSETKRLRAVLRDGEPPHELPEGTICHRRRGREWLVTVNRLYPEKVDHFRNSNTFEQMEIEDLGLEEIFKDYIRGARAETGEVLV